MQKIWLSRFRNEYLIILVGILLYILIQALGFNGLYGQDSYEYTRYCNAWITYFSGGVHPGDYHWPLNYPISGALLAYVSGISAGSALQLLSLVALIGNAILINRVIQIIYPGHQKYGLLWTIIGFVLAPYVLRTGLVCMSDQYASFLSLLAFYSVLLVVKKGQHWWIVGLVIFGGLAVMTRYISALMMLPIGIYVLPYLWRKRVWLPVLVAAAVAIIPVLPHYFIRMQEVGGFIDHPALLKWSVKNMFSRTFESDLGAFSFKVPNILYVFHPFVHAGFLFFGAVFILFIRKIKMNKEVILLLIVLGGFLLFTAGVDTQNDRYFITIMPFVVLLSYPMFEAMILWMINKLKKFALPIVAVLCVFQMGLAGYAFLKFHEINKQEKQLADLFTEFQGKTVYTYGAEMMLSNYNAENTFLTLHLKEGLDPEPGTFFLFNKSWLSHPQVKGLFQVKLWNELQQNERLMSLKTHNEWELYEVK
jgi:4-amino-4-deoxy-L-arabinose transferase-like glycosyltransferase